MIPASGASDKIDDMLSYFFAFVLLEKVAGIMNHNLRLVFRGGNERTEEDIFSSRDGVFIREHD